MKNELWIGNLKKIGLSEPESKVYIGLLKKKIFTATEISRISGTPRSKIYEILNKLINKGLCVEILGSVKKYSPANPKTAIGGLLQTSQQELDNKKILSSNLVESLLPFYNSQKGNGSPLDYIQVIREKASFLNKFRTLIENAEFEVFSLVKGPYIMDVQNPPDYYEEFVDSKDNIKFKTIYEVKELEDPDTFRAIKAVASTNEEIRVTDEIPFKMYIFDRKISMFTLEDIIDRKSSLTTMIVEHADMAKGLRVIFNMFWGKAIPIDDFIKKIA